MYTKKQVCELLRQHGINIDDVDQSFEIVDLEKKYNTDRRRKYMQFKRENDPEIMERINTSKSKYFSLSPTSFSNGVYNISAFLV